MKKHFYTAGLIVILMLAAVAFILAPAMLGQASKGGLPPFGKYDGKEIRYEQGSDFANYVSNYAQMLQNQGQQINTQTYYYIFDAAFNAVVQKLAYEKQIAKSGWRVPQSAINRKMLRYFLDENGNYSQKLYKQTPASQIAKIQNDAENSLALARYSNDVFGQKNAFANETFFGTKQSSAELAFLKSFGETQRSFSLASFNLNNYPETEKFSYGKAHAEKFSKFSLAIISTTDKSKANTVVKRLQNNEITFADAVGEYSDKNYSADDGTLSSAYTYAWQLEALLKNKADIEKIASLKKDAHSDAIELQNGFAIFSCKEEMQNANFEASETIAAVGSYLQTNEAGIIEDYFTKRANDFAEAARKNNFQVACKQFSVSEKTLDAFPLNYGSASIANSLDTSVEGLANADTNENFLKKAFALSANEISEPIVNGNYILVLQMKESKTVPNTESDSSIKNQIETYDNEASQHALMKDKKLTNNLSEVFQKYFLNNSAQ